MTLPPEGPESASEPTSSLPPPVAPPVAPPPPVWPPHQSQGTPPPGTPPPAQVPAATYPTYQSPSPYGGQPGQAPQNGLGVAALVLSILGLVGCLPLVGSILGIIFGLMGMKNADRGLADNKGVAKAGLVIGIIGAALWILLGIVWLVVIVLLLANEPRSVDVTLIPSPTGF